MDGFSLQQSENTANPSNEVEYQVDETGITHNEETTADTTHEPKQASQPSTSVGPIEAPPRKLSYAAKKRAKKAAKQNGEQ